MKRLAIVEHGVVNHTSSVYTLYRVFSQDCKVVIYTDSKVRKNLDEILKGDVEYVVRGEGESLGSFLKKVERDGSLDYVIFTTFKTHPAFYLYRPKAKTYLVVRNANSWFGRARNKGLKNMAKNIVMDAFDGRLDGVFVELEEIREHVLEEYHYGKSINVIPFCIYEGMEDRSADNKMLRMCIPGMVSDRRRNYGFVREAMSRLPDEYLGKITLELLGNPVAEESGPQIIEGFKELRKRGLELVSYDGFVSAGPFDEGLSRCDIILGPMNVSHQMKTSLSRTEVYGQSKSTGVNFAMIRAAKPGILPREMANIRGIDSSTVYFDSVDGLKELIMGLADDRKRLDELKKKARQNSRQFTPEAIRKTITL
jgi:hypothetical protein